MLTHHLFWATLALLFCAAMNINVYFKFNGSNIILQDSIGTLGILGLLTGHARLIMYSLEFNWWWFFGGLGVSVISIGVLSFLFRRKISSFFGFINFVLIPFFWWYGSRFNTVLSFDWFYNFLDFTNKIFA